MSLPSPADSPPPFLEASDPPSSQNSRKRLRSQSMESAGSDSSTVKRSIPDNGTSSGLSNSSRTEETSTLSLADQTLTNSIDSHMADGVAELHPNESTDVGMVHDPPYAAISGLEKLKIIETLKSLPMDANQTWYVVERGWYQRFKRACSGLEDKEGIVTEAELGAVDNSSLVLKEFIESCAILRPGVVDGIDVEFVPEEAWTNLQTWYGSSLHPIMRKTVAKGYTQQIQLDLYPLFVRLLRVSNIISDPTPTARLPVPYIEIPSTANVGILQVKLANVVKPPSPGRPPFRVWRLHDDRITTNGIEIPPSEISEHDKIIQVTDMQKSVEEVGIESTHVFAVEYKENDQWLVAEPEPLFKPGDQFFNNLNLPVTRSPNTSNKQSLSFKTTQGFGRQEKKPNPTDPGLVGLGNMGNTCFMNSALQCLAHQPELVEYFYHDIYKSELNPDNPLGMHGEIAEAFGNLMSRLWDTDDAPKSYVPRDFKMQLQRFAPQFQGYQQHDSQELVAFLLDGLHEDLNRVIKKPYVEKPDWTGKNDYDLALLAKDSWEGYMKRNDSVIVDLFQGQYQSTLTCPECQKVSITFDPFMYLTLPLPVNKKWRHTILYVPWDSSKEHVKIPVEIGRDGSMKDLKTLVGRWMEVNPENLMAVELWGHKFFKNFDDSTMVGEVQSSDHLALYELPCNSRQSKSRKGEVDDPIILPVYLSEDSSGRATYGNKAGLISYPSILVVDAEQAKSQDSIYDAVIERIRRWTSNSDHLYSWAPGADVAISIPPPSVGDSVTEIDENGKVSTLNEEPQEGDVVDERGAMVLDEGEEIIETVETEPVPVGSKKDIFTFRVEPGRGDFFVGSTYTVMPKKDSWKERLETGDALLKEGDTLFCHFDENMRDYFFAGNKTSELYATWTQFLHPEYEESRKASEQQSSKGLTLQDCLDEFTKEEKLGEEDLWYCPSCKKHQQATKKFDLWKTPDILVVHLKRFSNSRALRDKIDAHIDFPIKCLDLSPMVGERLVSKRLLDASQDLSGTGLKDPDDGSWTYDLFAVDEHLGGLGGGHYRAYAHHHEKDEWFHFDDSHVSPASAEESVNSNAYLLFYRRRSPTPLGGTTHTKIQEARGQPKSSRSRRSPSPEAGLGLQLPTPPSESQNFLSQTFTSYMRNDVNDAAEPPWPLTTISNDNSPSSSLGVELDGDEDGDAAQPTAMADYMLQSQEEEWDRSPSSASVSSRMGSPSSATSSLEQDPFADANAQSLARKNV